MVVTVIIPTYNGARFLAPALASVFAQDPLPGEVLVIDDGSTDDTPALLAREPRAPTAQVLLGRQRLFAEPGTPVPSWVEPEWLLEAQEASNTAVLVARREAFDRVGLFDVTYESGEDTEWLLRARQAGVVIERLPDVVVHKRLHGGNLSVETFDRRKDTIARIAFESIRRRRSEA